MRVFVSVRQFCLSAALIYGIPVYLCGLIKLLAFQDALASDWLLKCSDAIYGIDIM